MVLLLFRSDAQTRTGRVKQPYITRKIALYDPQTRTGRVKQPYITRKIALYDPQTRTGVGLVGALPPVRAAPR